MFRERVVWSGDCTLDGGCEVGRVVVVARSRGGAVARLRRAGLGPGALARAGGLPPDLAGTAVEEGLAAAFGLDDDAWRLVALSDRDG